MALNKYHFGDLIELNIIKNKDQKYGENDAIGVNIDKVILPMRGHIENKDFEKFNLVPPRSFAYNPRGSRKLGLGFNDTEKTYIITFNDNVFKIKDSAKNKIIDTYLFMYLSRKEWDRRAEFISWGSSTEVFDWNVFCEEEIQLPSVDIQQKYVDVYLSMLNNQKAYENGLDDLKMVCEAFIENIRKKTPIESISPYLIERCETNKNGDVKFMRGVGLDGFIEPNQQRTAESLKKCSIFYKGDFVYAPSSFKNGVISYNNLFDKAICTEEYIVFHIKDETKLNPYYLLMWLKREQLGRYIDFASCDSVRNRFYFKDLDIVEIPIPDISVQNKIADLYQSYLERIRINELLKKQLRNICPILIKGSVEEAKRK